MWPSLPDERVVRVQRQKAEPALEMQTSRPSLPTDKVVFETKWFNIVSRQADDSPDPHYVIGSPDFAVVIALETSEKLLLVRQYRHGVQSHTLEFPSGHVEIG